jgi:hypothetical protein
MISKKLFDKGNCGDSSLFVMICFIFVIEKSKS